MIKEKLRQLFGIKYGMELYNENMYCYTFSCCQRSAVSNALIYYDKEDGSLRFDESTHRLSHKAKRLVTAIIKEFAKEDEKARKLYSEMFTLYMNKR